MTSCAVGHIRDPMISQQTSLCNIRKGGLVASWVADQLMVGMLNHSHVFQQCTCGFQQRSYTQSLYNNMHGRDLYSNAVCMVSQVMHLTQACTYSEEAGVAWGVEGLQVEGLQGCWQQGALEGLAAA